MNAKEMLKAAANGLTGYMTAAAPDTGPELPAWKPAAPRPDISQFATPAASSQFKPMHAAGTDPFATPSAAPSGPIVNHDDPFTLPAAKPAQPQPPQQGKTCPACGRPM